MGWCLSVKYGGKNPYTEPQYSVVLFLYVSTSVIVININITSFCLESVNIKPLATAALNGPCIRVPISSISGMGYLLGETEVLGGKPSILPVCPQQISYGIAWA